jgi:mannosyltransferase
MQSLEAASPVQSDSARRAHWTTFLLLLVADGIVRFLFLARKPFWFDECFSVEVARISRGNFLDLLWWREANMSLYYVLLRIWLHFSPRHAQSEFFIRSLSAMFAVATLPAVYWLARQLYDRRVALIAAALFAFNAYSVRYAQEARSYSLFLLLATLSSCFLIAFLRDAARRYWLGYVIVSILAVYAHFYALLLLAAHGLALRWYNGGGASQRLAARPQAECSPQLRRAWLTIGLAVLPLLVFVAKTGAGPIRWIQRPSWRDVFEFYERLAGGNNWALPVLFAVAGIAALAPARKQLWARPRDWEKDWNVCWGIWRRQFLLIWLFLPVLLTVLLSFARPVFLSRYLIFCLPALVILAAAGIARLRPWWLLAAVLTGTLVLCGQGIFFVYGHDFDSERDASGAATDFILDHAQPGDAIIFHIAATRIPYEFFRSARAHENTASPSFRAQLGPEIMFPDHGPGLDYRDFTGKPTAELLRMTAGDHPRVWIMLMNNGPAENRDATTIMLTKTLSESSSKMWLWQFTKVEVRLYTKP